MFRLSGAVFLLQAGFHAFTAPFAFVLSREGVSLGEIGLILGVGSLVQIPAAVLIAPLLPVLGPHRVIFAGAGAYALSAVTILLTVGAAGSTTPYYLARLLQGIGISAVLPAALSLASAANPAERRGLALGVVSSAHNLTMAVFPALALAVLSAASLGAVAVMTLAIVVIGMAVVTTLPVAPESRSASGNGLARWRLRKSWMRPLLVTCLATVFWGLLQTYLPPRLAEQQEELTTFLIASGASLVVARVVSGWLADRTSPSKLSFIGALIGCFAVVSVLVEPATHGWMVAAGIATGSSIGLIYTPVLLELARTSTVNERGVAFALFGLALSSGLALGSAGVAPLVESAGFTAGVLVALAGLAGAAYVSGTAPRGAGHAGDGS